MFGGYNAGAGTMLRARRMARERQLDERRWHSVVEVAPQVPRWRWRETLGYVTKIEDTYELLRLETRRSNAARRPPFRAVE
jgi:membrane-bound lytic murein transglycosylase MltF